MSLPVHIRDVVEPLMPFLEQAWIFFKSHFVLCLSVTVSLLLYHFFSRRLNITRELEDIGFDHVKKEKWRHKHYIKHPEDMVPVFPNGWFALIESRDLAVGEVKAVTALGQQFAVFRGQEGTSYILDAYCPHLGAHLAIGGQVRGECLECPFHGWTFKGSTGACTVIPTSQSVPASAKVKTWPSCEINGLIMVWYHAEGEKPIWMPVAIPQVENGTWLYGGRNQHVARCHIQDISENGADTAHLKSVHSCSTLGGRNLKSAATSIWKFVQHIWKLEWTVGTLENPHLANGHLEQWLNICGWNVPFLYIDVTIKQIGPSLVHIHVESVFGPMVFVQYTTPEGPLTQRVCQLVYAPKCVPQIVINAFLVAEGVMLERDFMIWNNKQFVRKPVLVAADGFLAKFRRWYSQFYSEHSPTLQDFTSTSLDW